MRYIKLALITTLSAVLFASTLSFAASPPTPVVAANTHLVQAYHTAWTGFKNIYADRNKLTDIDLWEHKFDNDLRAQADLDRALQQLIDFVGDTQAMLITPSDVAKIHAVEVNQRLGYGVRFHRGNERQPDDTMQTIVKTVTDVYGPAQQAGIISADTVESIQEIPVQRLSDAQLQAMAGECKLGDRLRMKVTRRSQPFTVSCGLAPVAAEDSFSVYTVKATPLKGTDIDLIRIRITNMDDARVRPLLRAQLNVKDGETHPIIFDLRGASGRLPMRATELAALLLQQGMVSCEEGGEPSGQKCFLVDNGKATDKHNDPKFKLASFMAHKGPIVVLIDGDTAGTALTFAAALQAAGAKTVAIGDKTRRFDDVSTYLTLNGDPLSRSLLLPAYHVDQPAASSLAATEAVNTLDEALVKAADMLSLKEAPPALPGTEPTK
jgi:C-terminal processing protease CtpA/Prc